MTPDDIIRDGSEKNPLAIPDRDKLREAMLASKPDGVTVEQIDAHLDAFAPEDLDPELEACLAPTRLGGTGIYHPLVHEPFYFPPLNKHMNRMLHHKKERLAVAVDEADWHSYVFLHERPYRHYAFRSIVESYDLDDAEYWDLLHDMWVDTENPWQWGEDVRLFFTGRLVPEDDAEPWDEIFEDFGARPGVREHFMGDTDKRAFDVLDDEILIYRGYSRDGTADGWSWTTDHLIGLWFARRFSNDDVSLQHLVVGKVRKDDVIAYSQGRGESEVIVDPDKVYDKQEVVLSATCECGLPMPVIERITHEQHMAKHAGAHTNKEVR